ncbi:MAG: hypothetical protein ACOYW3_02190, partial [Bacteroidota bacterium]
SALILVRFIGERTRKFEAAKKVNLHCLSKSVRPNRLPASQLKGFPFVWVILPRSELLEFVDALELGKFERHSMACRN